MLLDIYSNMTTVFRFVNLCVFYFHLYSYFLMSFSVPLTSFIDDVKICVTSYFMYGVSHEGKLCTFNKILVRKRIKHRWEDKTEQSQTHAGNIYIVLQLGGPAIFPCNFPSSPLTGVRSCISSQDEYISLIIIPKM